MSSCTGQEDTRVRGAEACFDEEQGPLDKNAHTALEKSELERNRVFWAVASEAVTPERARVSGSSLQPCTLARCNMHAVRCSIGHLSLGTTLGY